MITDRNLERGLDYIDYSKCKNEEERRQKYIRAYDLAEQEQQRQDHKLNYPELYK